MDTYLKDYELSIWDLYPDEKKVCVIGWNDSEIKSHAKDLVLTKNVNGNITLKFTMYTRYYNELTNEFEDNLFIDLLPVEACVKLKYDGEWYDFVITNRQENSEQKTYTYTAKSLHIQELAKNGFNLEFNAELGNNIGTIQELGKKIVEGTEWIIDETGSDTIRSYQDDQLLIVTTQEPTADSTEFGATIVLDGTVKNIPRGKKLYAFYTDYIAATATVTDEDDNTAAAANVSDKIQCFYSDKFDNLVTNDLDKLIYEGNYYTQDGIIDRSIGFNVFVSKSDLKLDDGYTVSQFKGERLQKADTIVYEKALDRYVTKYKKDGETDENASIRGYVKTEFLTPDYVQELAVNGKEFVNNSGWYPMPKENQTNEAELSAPSYGFAAPALDPSIQEYSSFLKFGNGLYYNTAFRSNASKIGGIAQGAKFVVECNLSSEYTIKIYHYDGTEWTELETEIDIDNNPNDSSKHIITFKTSYSEKEVKNLRLCLEIANNDTQLNNISFFRKYDKTNTTNTTDYYLPGEVPPAQQKEKYFYYTAADVENNNWTTPEDFKYLYEGYVKSDDYTAVTNEYNKVTSIEKKESNRFNLIQELCEKFKCWACFEIAHESDGRIADNGRKIKFKEFVGDVKYSGFRNGVNLKSIQRTIDSDQISTKIIVKPNKNQHGVDGYSSIHRAKNNPIKQSYILNFDYYIQKGILNKEQVHKDLYEVYTADFDQGVTDFPIPDQKTEVVNGTTVYKYTYEITYRTESEDIKMETTNKYSEWKDLFTSQGIPYDSSNILKVRFKKNRGWKNPKNRFRLEVWLLCYTPTGFYSRMKGLTYARDEVMRLFLEQQAQFTTGMPLLKAAEEMEISCEQNLARLKEEYQTYCGLEYPTLPLDDNTYTQEYRDYMAKIAARVVLEAEIKAIEISLAFNLPTTEEKEAWRTEKQILLNGYTAENGERVPGLYEKLDNLKADIQAQSGYYTNMANALADPKLRDYFDQIARTEFLLARAKEDKEIYGEFTEENYNLLNEGYKTLIELLGIDKLENSFFKKYQNYIKEGSWTSEDYFDDDLYYIDALDVARTSSKPKVTYTINVIDVSPLPGFESFKVNVGDKTFVEDVEFFGTVPFVLNEVTILEKPYQEEVVVIETVEYLSSPEKNTIKVQNYKTQFDDLFQRITASQQQLQYASGGYSRASAAFNDDGTIDGDILQDSMSKYPIYLQGKVNDSILWNEEGIQIFSREKSSDIIRLSQGKISLSNNGGSSWNTAIDANGINASMVTTGVINTEEVLIGNQDKFSFRWDRDGLDAYTTGTDGAINYGKFVRFDQYGVYGYDGSERFVPTGLGDIKNNSNTIFGLTWDGFFLKSLHSDGGYLEIDRSNDLRIMVPHEEVTTNGVTRPFEAILKVTDTNSSEVTKYQISGTEEYDRYTLNSEIQIGQNTVGELMKPLPENYEIVFLPQNRLKIGLLNPEEENITKYHYGIRLTNSNGVATLETDGNGDLAITGNITATSGKIGGWFIDGNQLSSTDSESSNGIILDAELSQMRSEQFNQNNLTGWKIDNDEAIFNNITLRGALKCAVLEYGEVQAVGGILMVRPSTTIKKVVGHSSDPTPPVLYNKVDNTYEPWTTTEDRAVFQIETFDLFEEGDWIKLAADTLQNQQTGNGISSGINTFLYENLGKHYIIKQINEEDEYVPVLALKMSHDQYEDIKSLGLEGMGLIDLGKPSEAKENKSVAIALNSSTNEVMVPQTSLSVLTLDQSEEGWKYFQPHILLGKIPNDERYSDTIKGKYGLYADAAHIKGTIEAGSGVIGGWTITNSSLKKDDTIWLSPIGKAYELNNNNNLKVFKAGDNFAVDVDGNLCATNVNLSGAITATSGEIGGWKIAGEGNNKYIQSANEIIWLSTTGITANLYTDSNVRTEEIGSVVFKAGNRFGVTKEGALYASSGKIAGWDIQGWKLCATGENGQVCVVQAPSSNTNWVFAAGGTSHSSYQDCPFRVDKNGNLYATNADLTGTINAVTGRIGDLFIKEINGIIGKSIILRDERGNGEFGFGISPKGAALFPNLNVHLIMNNPYKVGGSFKIVKQVGTNISAWDYEGFSGAIADKMINGSTSTNTLYACAAESGGSSLTHMSVTDMYSDPLFGTLSPFGEKCFYVNGSGGTANETYLWSPVFDIPTATDEYYYFTFWVQGSEDLSIDVYPLFSETTPLRFTIASEDTRFICIYGEDGTNIINDNKTLNIPGTSDDFASKVKWYKCMFRGQIPSSYHGKHIYMGFRIDNNKKSASGVLYANNFVLSITTSSEITAYLAHTVTGESWFSANYIESQKEIHTKTLSVDNQIETTTLKAFEGIVVGDINQSDDFTMITTGGQLFTSTLNAYDRVDTETIDATNADIGSISTDQVVFWDEILHDGVEVPDWQEVWKFGNDPKGYTGSFYSPFYKNGNNINVRTVLRYAYKNSAVIGVQKEDKSWLAYINSNGNIACNNLQAQSGSLSPSDYRKKNTINPLNTSYSTFFDKLRPVTYKYNNGTSDRLHTGFIAQDIQQALIDSGISTQDFAGFVTIHEQVVDPDTGEETMVDMHYLRYEEFIALNTSEIQKLKKRVAELEQQLQTLQNSN